MEPTALRLLMGASSEGGEPLSSVSWAGNNDTSVTSSFPSLTYATSGNSNGNQTYSSVLPTPDPTGYYVELDLLGGFSDSPTQVAWLGVCNTTSAFTSSTGTAFTGWYWSGAIWYPSTQDSDFSKPLNAGKYRIALRLGAVSTEIYFGRFGDVRGPYPVPTGSLYLMTLGQGGFPKPVCSIANNGTIYKGGGGLF